MTRFVKFRHFGKNLELFVNFLILCLVFGNNLPNNKFSLFVNVEILTNLSSHLVTLPKMAKINAVECLTEQNVWPQGVSIGDTNG